MQKEDKTLDNKILHARTVYAWEWSLSAGISCSEKRTVFRGQNSRKVSRDRSRLCPMTNIRTYFHVNWTRLCLLSPKDFPQHLWFLKLGNVTQISVSAGEYSVK